MASFKKAVENVLLFEGGYSDDPVDPGGRTNFGISSKAHPEVGDVGELQLEDAIQIYYRDYWVAGKVYMIEDQGIANKLLSINVNAGIYQGTCCLQRALNAVHQHVDEDGIMGPITAAAVNSSDPKQLLAAFRSEVANFYRLLIQRKPQMAKYENGWMRRAYA